MRAWGAIARRDARWPGLGWAALALFGASGFAVAQPLFDIVSRHAAFLVAHRATPADILALAALALLGPPACAFAVLAAARALGTRAAFAALTALLGLFAAATALAPLARSEPLAPLGALPAVALALALGALASLAVARSAIARGFASALGLAPLAFAALFLLTGPVARLVRGAPDFRATAAKIAGDVPIVVLVFDEFRLTSLLGADEEIDATRHPSFAALASTATWYRDARSVHTSTLHALPAIATGRYPDPTRLPRAADYPESLFTLLDGSYAMHVSESQTMLFAGSDAQPRELGALRALVSEAWLVYLHVLLPEPLASRLPSIHETWGRFERTVDRERQIAVFGRKAVFEGFVDRQQRFAAFVDALDSCAKRCLHFLHVLLPHRPWELLPSGRRFVPWDSPGLGKQEQWSDDAWLVDQAHQQYLLQVGATDRLLGEVMSRLRELGLWEEALVVVLADHGVGFWPGESMRWVAEMTHPEDVIRVPMFVKAPRQSAPVLVSEPVLTIDVLPTMARALRIELPWHVDGCAISSDEEARACAAADAGQRARARIFDRDDVARDVPADLAERRASLDRKLALFGAGAASAFAFGPHSELVGTRVSERASLAHPLYRARFDRAATDALARDPDGVSLARVTAFLRRADGGAAPDDARVVAAIAVDDVVQAVAPARAHAAGSLVVSAIVPEHAVARGHHVLSIHIVDELDGELVLRSAGSLEADVP